MIDLTDFTLLSKPRTDEIGRGVGMHIANRLNFKKRYDLNTNYDNCPYESLFVEVEIKKIQSSLELCVNILTVAGIVDIHFNDVLRTILNERKTFMLMEDMNFDLLNTDTNHQTTDFVHNMFANMITHQTATLIDDIITDIHEYSIKSGILYNDISDHLPIFNLYKIGIEMQIEVYQNKYKLVFKRANNSNNITKLNTKLQNANWKKAYNVPNPNTSYDTFL